MLAHGYAKATSGDGSTGSPVGSPARSNPLLHKTVVCLFYSRGCCLRGTECTFAHGDEDIAVSPDLYRTQLCKDFVEKRWCWRGDRCRFAHGRSELRSAYATSAHTQAQPRHKKKTSIQRGSTAADAVPREGNLTKSSMEFQSSQNKRIRPHPRLGALASAVYPHTLVKVPDISADLYACGCKTPNGATEKGYTTPAATEYGDDYTSESSMQTSPDTTMMSSSWASASQGLSLAEGLSSTSEDVRDDDGATQEKENQSESGPKNGIEKGSAWVTGTIAARSDMLRSFMIQQGIELVVKNTFIDVYLLEAMSKSRARSKSAPPTARSVDQKQS